MKRKGISTIVVVFMVIILVTFGLSTMLSSNLNYKLSEKSSNWSKNYYELDYLGEKDYFEIEKILNTCERTAVEYIMNKEYLKDNSEYLDSSHQKKLKKIYEDNPTTSSIYTILNSVYKEKAYELISLSDNYDFSNTSLVSEYNDNDLIDSIIYTKKIHDQNDKSKYLEIKFSINDILFNISEDSGIYTGTRKINRNPIEILSWNAVYEQDDIEEGLEIWDPLDSGVIEIPNNDNGIGAIWDPNSTLGN